MNGVLGALVVVAALVVSVLGGWVLTSGVLRLAGRSPDAGAPSTAGGEGAPDVHAAGPDGTQARSVLRGGTWIGVLERIAITGGVLAGQPAAIAMVIAVKGLGRYPELRENPSASERFVIGTLASMIWAAVIGLVGRLLLA